MPTITLTVSAGVAARLQAALSDTPYPKTLEGLKMLLSDYLNSWVVEYERATNHKTALDAVAKPQPAIIT